MRGFLAILTLFVSLPLTLLAGLVGFLSFLARAGWALGVDAARWVLDPYPDDDADAPVGPEGPSPIGSPRTAAEILADIGRKNAAGGPGAPGVPGQELGAAAVGPVQAAGSTGPCPSGGGPHLFVATEQGVECDHCGFVPPPLGR